MKPIAKGKSTAGLRSYLDNESLAYAKGNTLIGKTGRKHLAIGKIHIVAIYSCSIVLCGTQINQAAGNKRCSLFTFPHPFVLLLGDKVTSTHEHAVCVCSAVQLGVTKACKRGSGYAMCQKGARPQLGGFRRRTTQAGCVVFLCPLLEYCNKICHRQHWQIAKVTMTPFAVAQCAML